MKRLAITLGIVAAAAGFGFAAIQDGMGGGQDEPQMPKPGREHELLKQFEGEWDAAAKFWMDPSQPPMESKGVEKSKMALGGFWLLFDYEGTMGPTKFQGHGMMGYDPVKKKYLSTWVDSWMPMLLVGEGEADKDGKVFTFNLEGRDPMTQQPTKERWTMEIKDKDTHVATFHTQKEGKWVQTGEIKYTRKK